MREKLEQYQADLEKIRFNHEMIKSHVEIARVFYEYSLENVKASIVHLNEIQKRIKEEGF